MISVVMTSYNGIRFIGNQVKSILSQLKPDDQLIIGDNGSTDGTIEYLQSLRKLDPRIIVSVYSDRTGVISNLNHALALARGDLIFLADQDDVWLNGRIDYCKNIFDTNSNLLLLQTNVEIIDEDGRKTGENFFALRKCGTGIWKNFWKNTWQGCNMVFRRDLMHFVYPIPENVPMHDVWIGIVAQLRGEVRMDPIILGLYRRHASNQSDLSPSSPKQIIKWRLQLIKAIICNSSRIKNRNRK